MFRRLVATALAGLALAAAAPPPVQSSAAALREDAAAYARLENVSEREALRRLAAQQASVSATDALAAEFADRLAGISIQHRPDYRIIVHLAGAGPVAARSLAFGDSVISVEFVPGAAVTERFAVAALGTHLAELNRLFPRSRGIGYDPRTASIVIMVRGGNVAETAIAEGERLTGVPLRIIDTTALSADMSLGGGIRLEGLAGGIRQRCTAGFVVTDGARTGIATAAHCPDELIYREPGGATVALPYVGQWGVAYRDLQINLADAATAPVFYANRTQGALRLVETWRNRSSTRVGEIVCHWGESSGYSCAEVAVVHFAPPGELCGGPCTPTWVAVRGPSCLSGDSGGPVFLGTTAFGIAKGSTRTPEGQCLVYFYMSTDYLPPPWALLHGVAPSPRTIAQ
jgi:hypothetical protein